MYTAADAIKDTVLFSAEFVPQQVRKIRIEICSGCKKFRKMTRTCQDCGCQMDLKAMYAKSSCPDEKW